MKRSPLTKAVLALATTLAVLVAFATPSSASAVSVSITGGTLTVNTDSFNMAPGSGNTPPCSDPTDTLTFNPSGSSTSGTWTLTGTLKSWFQLGTPPSGTWYQADITIAANGTYSGSPNTYTLASASPNHVTFQAQIYNMTGTNCAKTNRVCVVTGRMGITSGTFSGSMPTPATGDTATISGSTAATGGLSITTTFCSAPFSSWHGQTATLAGMTAVVV